MKVVMLMASNSRSAGGLFNSVKSLALALRQNLKLSILSFNDKFSDQDLPTFEDLDMFFYKLKWPKSLGFSSDIHSKLKFLAPDIIHQQGIWLYKSKATLLYKKKNNGSKSVIAPRGMLDSWALQTSGLKKRLIRVLYEDENIKKCDCFHALNESEYRSIRKYGYSGPIAIIPNGINLPAVSTIFDEPKVKDKKNLLFIGRIHPKKGLNSLLEALHILKQNGNGFENEWNIRIAGWSQIGHEKELIKMSEEFGLTEIVKFIGPVYSQEKSLELRNANAFILPSHSEGLPMSVLEAWSFKLPVLMTEACNIPEGFSHNAALEISTNSKKMALVLEKFFDYSKEELNTMGTNGYELVKNRFTWDSIARDTKTLYEWLLDNNKEKPAFVKLN